MNYIYKKIKKSVSFVLIIVHLSILSFGSSYYISNTGNDSNSGMTEALAWKTIAKISSFSFTLGDSIRLKCGDIWQEGIYQLSNGIVLSSYGTGKKPELRGWGKLTGYDISSNWTEFTTGVWRKTSGNIGSRLWVNGKERKESSSPTLTDEYFWHYDGTYLYIKSPSNPATYFKSIDYGNLVYDLVNVTGLKDLTLDGINFSGGRYCLRFHNIKNSTIKNCEIGYRAIETGLWVTSTTGDSCINVQIYNNIFNSGDSLRYNYYRRNGTTRVLDGATADCINVGYGSVKVKVFNNYIYGWTHCGVYLQNLSNSFPFHDNEVYQNFITAPLIEYSRGLAADFINGYNNSIHNNTVVNTSIQNQFNANGLKVFSNIIDNVTGTPFPEKPGKGNGIAIEAYSCPAINMEIYDNTILNCFNGGIRLYGSNDGMERSGNNFHDNNIFNNNGVGAQLITYKSTTIHDNIYTNNHLFSNNTTLVVRRDGADFTVSEFNITKILNGDKITGNNSALKFGKFSTNLNDLKIIYNDTPNAKVVNLSQPMIDKEGTKYLSNVTLKPYSSLILMKDNNPATGNLKNLNDVFEINIFPNPCHSILTIKFSSMPDIGSKIEILDLSGRKVASRMITGMSEEFNLDRQAVGVYLIKSIIDSREIIKKMIIN